MGRFLGGPDKPIQLSTGRERDRHGLRFGTGLAVIFRDDDQKKRKWRVVVVSVCFSPQRPARRIVDQAVKERFGGRFQKD